MKISRISLLTFKVLILLTLVSGGSSEADAPATDDGNEFFEEKIRPVLVQHCYACHSADAKAVRGGLLVDHAAGFRKGGDSGATIVPGDTSAGTLLEALRYETFEMPPQQKLPAEVIKDFETWIAMGAPDPRTEKISHPVATQGIDLAAGRNFWSFRPVQKIAPPEVFKQEWPKSNIDRFILAAQESRGLRPGPDAGSLTRLRRLYFDLIGLPPSVEEILKYQADLSQERWTNIVDELLASPQFGERWGRHWLDLARYSNSTGGGRSLLYGDSWRYRNYVLDAFHNDKPYDQFVREQIAGDLLQSTDYRERREQLIATGFLALGPHNYENQDKEQLRMDVVDEQIDTVGRVFLGMTIACARCHDHKFDPIPTTDYYALAGIFRSTNSLVNSNVSKWVSTPLPLAPEEEERQQQLATESIARNKEIQKLRTQIENLKADLPALIVDNDSATLVGNWVESTSVSGFVGKNYQHSNDPNASATYEVDLEPGEYEIRLSYTEHTNRPKAAKVTIVHANEKTERSLNQQLAPNINGTFHSLGAFTANASLAVVIRPDGAGSTIIDAVQFIPKAETDDKKRTQIEADLVALNQRLKLLEKEQKKEQPPQAEQIVSVAENETPGDYFVCIRGDAHNLGQSVPRGVLSVVAQPTVAEISEAASGRLELANWLANAEHPLTSRVYVNRVWQHLFGVGLVRTVDHFGIPGETPSHPELLDFLAHEFTSHGWSTKHLIRQIVLSRTYQLAGDPLEDGDANAENRWLTHQNRRRLSAEAIHDALLSFSGELDRSPANKTVRPETKSEYGYQFDFGKRAVYLPVFRNQLPDLLAVFDFPDPNLSQGRRTSSTISPQALFMMNSEFVQTRAGEMATRILDRELTQEEQLEWLILTILNRYPSSNEQRVFSKFLGPEPTLERWTQVCQALFGSLDFRFLE